MPKKLPARPNLEHLRSQAKTLLAKLREGDPESARTFMEHLPEAAGLKPEEVRHRGFRLADAQLAIARKTGFGAWPSLARHVERLRSLEGTWAFRALEIDGRVVPAPMLGPSRLLLDGDRFRMESPEANYEGIFTIDVERTPHRIDIDFVEGPEAGKRSEGLFELDGDRLRFCLGLTGSARPERFETRSGSGHALEELERVEHARPPGVDGGIAQPASFPEPESLCETGDFEGALTPTLEKLQGEWTPLELITSGAPLQKSYLAFGSRSLAGNETKVVFGGQTMLHAKVRINESATPLELDYLNVSGQAKGKLSLGLFRWDGEEAVFCVGAPGGPRPADFTCPKGSGRTFSKWRRKATG
jgi:uncharacterized protein (TIGR03067 family)